MLCFGNAFVLLLAVPRFFISVAVVIVGTAIAVIVAARKPAGSSAVKPIANISELPKAERIIAIVSGSTADVTGKKA